MTLNAPLVGHVNSTSKAFQNFPAVEYMDHKILDLNIYSLIIIMYKWGHLVGTSSFYQVPQTVQ